MPTISGYTVSPPFCITGHLWDKGLPCSITQKSVILSSSGSDILLAEFQCLLKYESSSLPFMHRIECLGSWFWGRTVVQKHLIRSPQHDSWSGIIKRPSSEKPPHREMAKEAAPSSSGGCHPCWSGSLQGSLSLAQQRTRRVPSGDSLTRKYPPTQGDIKGDGKSPPYCTSLHRWTSSFSSSLGLCWKVNISGRQSPFYHFRIYMNVLPGSLFPQSQFWLGGGGREKLHRKQKLYTKRGETLEDIFCWALIPFSRPFPSKTGPLLN